MTKLNTRISSSLLLAALSSGIGLAADPPRAKRAEAKPTATQAETSPLPPEPQAATFITYGERDVVPVKTRLRYTTLIVLPSSERILDVTCGDKEFWAVNSTENMAFVKPAKSGSETNLNLIAASGNIYSFVLQEISDKAGAQPDLKVFVELREGTMSRTAQETPTFVSAKEIDGYRQQLEAAHTEVARTKAAAQAEVDAGISTFIKNVRFPYHFEAGKKPFNVRAMYHDDKFTYIQARPEEAPALYEIKDGKPSLVNFDYENGVYVARKILYRGYLAIGKQKLEFNSEE